MSMAGYEFSSRYDVPHVTGPERCYECDGFGTYPLFGGEGEGRQRRAWEAAEKADPSPDGWHFVRCPGCDGPGRKR
jgi:hypothetical protein